MQAHVVEWLNLVVRWVHFITGVAWIGASFYFNWLENSLNRINQREEIAGSLWAVHGGGFYYLEKYRLAPKEIPQQLHWFKYEAYATWLSGFTLLAIVYYWNASLYLIDPTGVAWSASSAVMISLVSLIGSWVVYDQLCKSPLGKSNTLIGWVGFGLGVVAAFAFSQIFSARAAYIHVGAILGTCMVANVFFVIIPSQKAMVAAAVAGKSPDGTLGKKAFQRSLHNNYMTLPVLFLMISHHFPSTYGSKFNWAILAGLCLVGAMVRHWFNLKGRGHLNVWILPAATLGILALAFVTRSAAPPPHAQGLAPQTVDFRQVEEILQRRCLSCHSLRPTDATFPVAPAGVVFDSRQQVKVWAERIKARAVTLENMPFGNKTGMTKGEREILGRWVDAGASIEPAEGMP